MGLIKKYFSNTRKPDGILGKMMVSGMNKAHAGVSDWGIRHLSSIQPQTIIELGCGGGRNAAQLLNNFPKATLTALDYSEVSVEKTKQVNRREIQHKRCQVLQGDVATLPFSENSFDLATAFETVYFWPDLPQCFREVYRVLKVGGTFFICNESNGDTDRDEKWTKLIGGMSIYKDIELKAYLEQAGFHGVQIHKKKSWLCITARK